jgi:single-strand DNA-binding protein
MYQQITIVGYVGRNAELRYTPSGKAVANFSVATSKISGSGEDRKEKTTWFTVTVWETRAEMAAEYVKKGMRIMAVGEVAANAYTSKDGTAQATLELTAHQLIFMSSKAEAERRGDGNKPVEETESTPEIPF